MASLETGLLTTTVLSGWLRDLYSEDLLDFARPLLVYDQFADVRNEPGTGHAKKVYWDRVYDLDPAIGTLTENVPYVQGDLLTKEQVSVTVYEYGNVVKTSEYLEVTEYVDGGNLQRLVRDKIARNMAESMDILARNTLMGSSNKRYAGGQSSRAALTSSDKVTVDDIEVAVRNLKGRDAIGFGGDPRVIGVIHPYVTYDLRRHPEWINAQHYAGSTRLFNGEVGEIAGVRFVETTLAKVANAAGSATASTQLNGATSAGATQITVDSTTGFTAGDQITVGASASPPLETDSGAEVRTIDSVDDGTTLTLTRALSRAHADNKYVVEGPDLYPVVFVAPGGLGKGVGLAPEVRVQPPIDDYARLFRVAWYGIFGYGILKSEMIEVLEARATA